MQKEMNEKYGIDETHGIRHSMNAYRYSEMIYNSEIKNIPSRLKFLIIFLIFCLPNFNFVLS